MIPKFPKAGKCDYLYDLLRFYIDLAYWLAIQFRIDFKILILTYKATYGLAQQNISKLPKRNIWI
jgi:hypothetical protein